MFLRNPSRPVLSVVSLLLLAACSGAQNPGSTVATASKAAPKLALLADAAASSAAVCDPYSGAELSSLNAYEGLTHEHSSYSDGDPQFTPADYYRIARERGYDFVAGSEHSDSLDAGNYASLHASCDPSSGSFDPAALEYCFLNPGADKLTKWNSTQEMATAASSEQFLAIRGFEWTSDVFGHINVYFSQNFTNAKTDGGYALSMQTFWDWFTRSPATPGDAGSASSPVPYGGGGDALAHFNHPHDKCQTKSDPSGSTTGFCDWNDYQLIPAAEPRVFGIEAYNDGNRGDRYQAHLSRALDRGWHLSFVGSEDEHFGQYAVETRPKTVTLATGRSTAAFKEAWLARRTYALSPGVHLRAQQLADGAHPMGSRLSCAAGQTVPLTVSLKQKDGTAFNGEYRLFSNGGVELAKKTGESVQFQLPVDETQERWYFVRAHSPGGASVAYLAPVWIKARAAAAPAPSGSWLGGDMHVHDDHSSDGSAPRQANGDQAPGNVSVADQIGEAERQGLQWLPLTDHRTYDQHYDPLWESSQLILIPGEEANGAPHCTVHGAVDTIDQASAPAGSPEFRSIQQSLWSAHAQGATWVVAHPDDGELNGDGTPNNRANLVGMDSMEGWNRGSNIEVEIAYAENRWNRGFRFGINGASDDHFRELWGASSPGTPRTHVFASQRSERAILQAQQAGRTMLQLRTTDPFVTLEADFNGDGVYEYLQGDEALVPAGTAGQLRVRVSNGSGSTVKLYQAPGSSLPPLKTWMPVLTDESYTLAITAPATPTWYRVEVRGSGEPAYVDVNAAQSGDFALVFAQQQQVLGNQLKAIASPIFVAPAPVEAQGEVPLPADAGSDDGALLALGQSGEFSGFPAVSANQFGSHVVAEAHRPGVTEVFYQRRNPDGSFSGALRLSGTSPAARFPKIASSGANVWVVWEDERGGQMPRRKAIYLRQSIDGGNSWLPEVALRVIDGRAEHPVIAVGPDHKPVIAWAEIRPGLPFDVWAQKLDADAAPLNVSGAGKIFGAPTPLDSRSAVYPASVWPALAAAADGRLALTWQDNRSDIDPLFTGAAAYGDGTDPDNWQIQIATRAANGTSWTAARSLGANDRADRHPAVAFAKDGRLALAWDSKPLSSSGPNLTVLTALSSDGGASYSAPVLVGGLASAFGQRPALSRGADGRVQLAWFDNRSADWRWRLMTAALAADGSWVDATLIKGPGINTWPAVDGGALVFASTRNAQRLQRDRTQQIFLIPPPVQAVQPFQFIERNNVAMSSLITSESIQLTGYTGSLPISISAGSEAQYSLNRGPFTAAAGLVSAQDRLSLRHRSAAAPSTTTISTVTVGSYSTAFKTVTTAADRVPDAYSFGSRSGVEPDRWIESADIVLSGTNASSPISAGPGIEYSLDGGASYTAAAGQLAVGAPVRVRLRSNAAHLGYSKGSLKVGGVSGSFTVRSR